MQSVRFRGLRVEDLVGVVTADGFTTRDSYRPYSDTMFAISTVAGLRIAVFVEEGDMAARIPQVVALGRPHWLDAMLYVAVDEASNPPTALVDARILDVPDADLATCAFVAAVAAQTYGRFKYVQESCEVRLGTQVVAVQFDLHWDSETWFGAATIS
jgi:hypothetical protein